MIPSSFLFIVVASSAGGLRNRNATAFASLKTRCAVFNSDFVGTEPKEAAYPVTGERKAVFYLGYVFVFFARVCCAFVFIFYVALCFLPGVTLWVAAPA